MMTTTSRPTAAKRTFAWGLALSLALLAMAALSACQAGQLIGDPEIDDALETFAATASKKGVVEACKELSQLCQSTGKGCKAHDLFCNKNSGGGGGGGAMADGGRPPRPDGKLVRPDGGQNGGGGSGGSGGTQPGGQSFRDWICAQLKRGCQKYPRACDIYKHRCVSGGGGGGGGGQMPHPDAGMRPDQGPHPDSTAGGGGSGASAQCCAALKDCAMNKNCAGAAAACGAPAGTQLTPDKAKYLMQHKQCR